MDYSDQFMLAGLRLDEDEEDESQNLTWGGFPRGVFPFLPPDLPPDLVEMIIWKHLRSQPGRRLFELMLVCKWFRNFLTKIPSIQGNSFCQSCVLREDCLQKRGCKHRVSECSSGTYQIVCWGTHDLLQKTVMPIPCHPSCRTPPLCKDPVCKESTWISLPEWRVSSSQGGEPGLLYLQKSRGTASASTSNGRIAADSITQDSIAEWLVLNPFTKSRRQLPFQYMGHAPRSHFLGSVDRFRSGYFSWASDGGEEMYPLLLDSVSKAWKRIGSGFITKGRIRFEKALQNEVVYLRYKKPEFKNLIITYDVLRGSFREIETTGLSDNICDDHQFLFHCDGHIYLAAGQSYPPARHYGARKSVVIYELECTTFNWMAISEIPSRISQELTNVYPALSELKFLHIERELVVASLVTERRTDGNHIVLDEWNWRHRCRRLPPITRKHPCRAIAAFDLTTASWRQDEAVRFGAKFDRRTFVFRPRLDIDA